MVERANVPAIRFKNFDDEWIKRKLNQFAIFNPKAMLPDKFEYVDLESVVGTEMLMHRTEFKGTAPSRAQRVAINGDVFFQTVRPYQKNNYLYMGVNGDFVFSTGYAQMRPIVNSHFLLGFIQNKNFLKKVLEKCTGTGYPSISSTDLSQIESYIPENLDEQKRIGSFFYELDHLITLQQRKLAKLKNVKEALLEKMFPQSGESEPQIRFAGFSGAWEQRKLGEIFEYLWNNSLSRADLSFEKKSIKNIHYGDVLIKFPEILDLKKEEVPYISKNKLNISNTFLLQDGDIVIADAAEDETVGKCCELKNVSDCKVVSGLHTIPCRPKVLFGTGFLGFYLNSSAYHNQLLPLIQGSKISSISKSTLQNTPIKYPRSIDEQRQIGTYFSNFNSTITFQQQKIEKLQNFKKACLEKMFV